MATITITEEVTTVTVTETEDGEVVTLTETAPIVLTEQGVGLQGPDSTVPGPPGPTLPIVFYRSGLLAPVTGRAVYRFPFTATLTGLSAAVPIGAQPLGSSLTAVIKVNGVTAGTVTILGGATYMAEVPLNVPIAVGDYVTADIVTVGSTFPGEDLSIFIRYE